MNDTQTDTDPLAGVRAAVAQVHHCLWWDHCPEHEHMTGFCGCIKCVAVSENAEQQALAAIDREVAALVVRELRPCEHSDDVDDEICAICVAERWFYWQERAR